MYIVTNDNTQYRWLEMMLCSPPSPAPHPPPTRAFIFYYCTLTVPWYTHPCTRHASSLFAPGRDAGVGWGCCRIEGLSGTVHVLRDFEGYPGMPRAGRTTLRRVRAARLSHSKNDRKVMLSSCASTMCTAVRSEAKPLRSCITHADGIREICSPKNHLNLQLYLSLF